MTTIETSPISAGGNLFDQYTAPTGVYDEMFSAPGVTRPAWQQFVTSLHELGPEELSRRWQQAERLVRDNGLMYNAYGDPEDTARPWELDALPLVLGPTEWQTLSRGLIQRAKLLNMVLADLYGPQKLVTRGLVPSELLMANPAFARPFHGQKLPHDRFLHVYAADLARSPDGAWWVVGDRTDAPMGVGYALENRIVISRMLPQIFQACHVERLATFFIAMRETLRQLAPRQHENPRIVLLSEGPRSPSYFEDAYLARYLGYTLVEGGDLAVRDDHVLLKTLGGLLPVHVILRRLSDQLCDPLELRDGSMLGVPGLMQAIRAGNVTVTNALGSSLVESPGFMAFLPVLCRELLGEDLLLPSVATWWCGHEAARKDAISKIDSLRFKSAFRIARQDPLGLRQRGPIPPEQWLAAIEARPESYVAQELVARSSAPVWAGRGLQPARVALRAHLVASDDTYSVLPGGLVRVSPAPGPLDLSILAGAGSKDAWVISSGPVRQVSLLRPAGQPVELRRSGTELPSRVADNLFWLGRHVERAEGAARLFRTILSRLTSEAEPDDLPELASLVRVLASQGHIEPGFALEEMRGQLPNLSQAIPNAVFDPSQEGNLRSMVQSMYRMASAVRDRISIDSWRILNGIAKDIDAVGGQGDLEQSDVLSVLNKMLLDLSAFGGLVMESMTRTQGWRFLDLGRRLDRSLHLISLVRGTLVDVSEDNGPVLEAVLEVADSMMTYRSRYLANLQMAPILDLLLTDETNPRSLAFQLVALSDHVENLPRDVSQAMRSPEQRAALNALTTIRMADVESLSEKQKGQRVQLDRLLARLADQLPRLSDMISHKYLVHAGETRAFA